MKKLTIKVKTTFELDESEMNDLIALKQQHWGYSVEEQQQWFASNIRQDDTHLLIYRGGYCSPTYSKRKK